ARRPTTRASSTASSPPPGPPRAGPRLALAKRGSGAYVNGMSEKDERGLASPACFIGEADPSYMGYLRKEGLVERLNALLEAERAGAKVLLQLMRDHPEAAGALTEVQRDEGRYAGLLTRLVGELGGTPSRRTGDFVEK